MRSSNSAIVEWRSFWFLPIAAALGYSTSVIHIYSIGPFIDPLQHEFGWSRAQVSMGITIASIIGAVFCVPIGLLVDRTGPRRIGLIGVLLMTGAFALFSTATGTIANWILLWICAAFGALWVQASVWTSAVASRFRTSRGLAFAVTLSGASFAASAYPKLATWLIDAYGWRTAYAWMAGIWAALVFPILLLCFHSAPVKGLSVKGQAQPAEANASDNAVPLTGLTLAEGLRSPALYKLLAASGLFTFTAIAALVHFVPILKDQGASPASAANIASLIGIFSVIGRLGTGMLLDRFPGHRVGAVVFMAPVIASVLLLWNGSNPICQMIAAASIGLTVGAEIDVIAFLAAKHFGLKHFGALYGTLLMALSLGTAFGPLAAGAVYDHFGSYAPFLGLTIVFMLLGALALLSLGQPPQLDAVESTQ